jgi:hypothetical protein
MQVRQLKTLLQSFAEFGNTACDAEAFADLRDFAAVFPTGDETTAKFMARLKRGLPKGEAFACPRKLWMQLKGIESCLSAAAAKSSKDLSDLLAIFSNTHSTSTRESSTSSPHGILWLRQEHRSCRRNRRRRNRRKRSQRLPRL